MDEQQINKVINNIIQSTEELKALLSQGSVLDRKKLKELKEREIKWHDMSINQLSFYNNLLILLGTGFLGFAFKDSGLSNYHFTLSNAMLSPTSAFLSLVLMTISVFLGLLCGFNRLLDFRHSYKINVLRRKFYEENFQNYGEGLDHYVVKSN